MNTLGLTHLTMNEFVDKLSGCRSGESFVYATGNLAEARDKAKKEPRTEEMRGVANLAWRSYEDKKVCLTQRRVGANCFSYIATKTGAATSESRPRELSHAA